MNPLLVATDGSRAAASALRLTAALAERDGRPVDVVAVVEPLAEMRLPLPHREELEHAHAKGVAERVRDQVRDVVGPVLWPIHIAFGRAAIGICEVAREQDAALVVLGERQGPDADATALELIQLADRPVLTARTGTVPRVAVVGVDFRSSSRVAAVEALRLLGPEGELHLVHVRPRMDFPAAAVWSWDACYGSEVAAGFERLEAELRGAGATAVTTRTVDGDPAAELGALARALEADLLVAGSDGYTFHGRVILGRVAQRLVRDSTLAVLAVPARSEPAREPVAEIAVLPQPA